MGVGDYTSNVTLAELKSLAKKYGITCGSLNKEEIAKKVRAAYMKSQAAEKPRRTRRS